MTVDGAGQKLKPRDSNLGMSGEFGRFAMNDGRQYLTDWVGRASGGPGAPLPPQGAA